MLLSFFFFFTLEWFPELKRKEQRNVDAKQGTNEQSEKRERKTKCTGMKRILTTSNQTRGLTMLDKWDVDVKPGANEDCERKRSEKNKKKTY